jgi:hypothetical protein
MAERGEDAASPAGAFSVPLRTALLIVATLLTLIAAWRAASSALVPSAISQLPASALLLCLIALAQLRTPALALFCALAPLIGCFWASALFDLLAWPMPFFAGPFAFGAVLSILIADVFAVRALADEASERAASSLYLAMVGPSLAAFAPFAATALMSFLVVGDQSSRLAATDAMAAGISGAAVYAFLPALASFLPVDDAFVTRTNRLVERRTAFAYRLTLVVAPRWAMSVAGISLVLGVLGSFGGAPAVLSGAVDLHLLLLAAGLLLLAAYAVTGAWRDTLASEFALLVVAAIGLWAWARLKPGGPGGIADLDDDMAVASLLVLFVAVRAQRFARSEKPVVARTRAIEDSSDAILFACLGGLAAFLPSFRAPQAFVAIVIVVFAGLAALVFAPAATGALETILPKWRSVEERIREGVN